ncbi:SpoIIE family protein phosphatase [Sessilibacter corallicola]|uniref:SpoIIE family protein phosphatase n=1 Tax=Sessilibacter corallicola TaxID=2904075 RepID=A0ABQ0A4F0_9GAMM|nr:SpoIIE family protein phosphatase [Sessilibacter corallicola]MCE2026868.1 response regulator [Sessilibacter corallicola]
MVISKRKLLLIDDDQLVRQSIRAYLEDSGFEVFESDDGARGLELFQEIKPDVVLSDLRMPGIDGLNVLQEIHKINSEIGVIVISGAGLMNDAVEALRHGASDFLIKPIVDMEVLVHAINRTLERQDLLLENKRYRERLEQANLELKENLLTLEKDQHSGRLVQQRLLPLSPFLRNGYTATHRLFPSLYLSGDFIDYAYLGDRYLAFYLTDVAGHGASSAFVTIWLKHQVTRMVRENGFFSDPETFEQGTDWMLQEINGGLKQGRFQTHLTCLIGVIDTHEHQLRYSVAGHLPLPVLVNNGKAEFLHGKGKPVGIFPNPNWEVFSCHFPPDSSLIVLSDGIFETMNESSLIDKEAKLLELLSLSNGTMESVATVLGLHKEMDIPDDISVLSITQGKH